MLCSAEVLWPDSEIDNKLAGLGTVASTRCQACASFSSSVVGHHGQKVRLPFFVARAVAPMIFLEEALAFQPATASFNTL